jgi:hypothetical protein
MAIQFEWLSGDNSASISNGAYSVTRSGIATGLAAFDPDERTLRVTEDAQCPQLGDLHPYYDSGNLRVSDLRVNLIDGDKADVSVTYTTPSFSIIQSEPDPVNNPRAQAAGATEIGGSVLSDTTNTDKDGTRLSVSYLVTEIKQSDGSSVPLESSFTDTQHPEVEIFRPQMVLRKSTYQAASPFATAASYVGRVNSGIVWGFAARTLLCRNITGRYEGDGTQYLVEYEFEYRASTWDVRIQYTDSVTGQVPANVTSSGNKLVRIYPEIDFNSLGLTF